MIRRPPSSTRTDTLFPYTTLFRSGIEATFGAEREKSRLRTAAPSSFDPDPIPAHARATLESLYGQISVTPITGFTATAGTRYDHHNRFGSETTFAANAVYSPNGGATRSEERRVGKEGVSTGRSRWAPCY